MTNGDIVAALMSLRPGAQWVARGDDLTGIQWLDQAQARPTDLEITTEIARLNALPPPSLADKMDQVQFKIAFNHENRIRVLEGKAQITIPQFKAALTTLLGG